MRKSTSFAALRAILIVLSGWTFSDSFVFDPLVPQLISASFRHDWPASKTRCNNWLGDLWEEVIEFSTYGPAERKMLKAKRELAAAKEKPDLSDASLASFQQAKQKVGINTKEYATSSGDNDDNSSLSLKAFQTSVAATSGNVESDLTNLEFDGYALRDLLIAKWGVPLDIDFQRGNSQQTVYCTILPVAFGSSKCRHTSELEYLRHLQAVVEILYEYENLDEFLDFIDKTNRAPKPGIESVPFRLDLSPQQLNKVLGAASR